MACMPDAVQDGISHEHVLMAHVDLTSKNVLSVTKLAFPHTLKQIKVLIYRPTPIW